MSYLSHLECGYCNQIYDSEKVWNLCPQCNKPLLARYDLQTVGKKINPQVISCRESTIWRYNEVLPVRNIDNRLSLGEGMTPLFCAHRLAEKLGFERLMIKDESLNPTGSFKARGLCVAISRARELGIQSVSIPSAGNAAGAISAYAALAGMDAAVFMPADVPTPFISECRALGATVELVDGLITDCGKAAVKGVEQYGRFDVSTLKEPYRIEGKKTMGYEIAEQLNWSLPDVIVYPTGGGTGLIGMWKAFDEMETMGWIGSKRPRMVTVQSDGCAPIVRAFENGDKFAEPWTGAKTIAAGLRVPGAVGDFLILRALRESSGTAVAVPDSEIMKYTNMIGRTQGIFACPEGGAALAAFVRLRKKKWIHDEESVIIFNTGSGHKYSHLWE